MGVKSEFRPAPWVGIDKGCGLMMVIASLQAAGLFGDGFPARWAGLRDFGPLGLRIDTTQEILTPMEARGNVQGPRFQVGDVHRFVSWRKLVIICRWNVAADLGRSGLAAPGDPPPRRRYGETSPPPRILRRSEAMEDMDAMSGQAGALRERVAGPEGGVPGRGIAAISHAMVSASLMSPLLAPFGGSQNRAPLRPFRLTFATRKFQLIQRAKC